MRSFESTGPDVKIRGTPSHIAEKYVALARDALSSGDPVLAENYLQHAEHYNRIILSYREQMAQGGMDPLSNGAAQTHNLAGPDGNDGDEFGDDEGDEFGVQLQQSGNSGEAPQQPLFNSRSAISIIRIAITRTAMIASRATISAEASTIIARTTATTAVTASALTATTTGAIAGPGFSR